MPAISTPVTPAPHRKLLSVTVLLAVLPAAICVPGGQPAPNSADQHVDSAMLTEINADGVRVIVD